jgi:TP901 family phage tail tape measure protein|nr:MAG TPA: tail tape measure protein [Caudoviricetes sp.]
MGKNLKEEDLRLNIIVNGDPARKEIGQLTRSTKDLRSENGRLLAEQKKLRAEGGENKARIAEITATIKKNSETIKANEARTKQLRSEMKVTSMTMAELSQRHAELRNAMRNVVPGTPQWKLLRNELQAVTGRMAQLRTETTVTEGVMCRMATNVNKYIGTVTASFAALAMYGSGLHKTIQTYSGLDEAMSNARKTTNMTRLEVEELNAILANIDTRTAQNELLALARIGGKLGIAKNDIEGFTRAADIIKISLGKDLGDNVETTIGQIGKLVNVFQIKDEFGIEEGMMKTAAAVNELGKASTANEANIVEFMRRVGGVGHSAKISLSNIAGLGATLDDLGQTMEVAGTSMSQVITGMYRRTDAFAAAAKMSVKDFKKLMAEDMNEALIRMLDGMGSNGDAMGKIVAALDSLKLDGTRATGVLTALAQNTGKLREQQEIANRAYTEGTSCLKEFNIMNNSAEAIAEKRKKQITAEASALGKTLLPAYYESLSAQAALIKTARILIEWLIKNKGVILVLVAAYASYAAAAKIKGKWDNILLVRKKLLVTWSKAHQIALMREALAMKEGTASTKLMAAAQLLLAGNLRAAGLAFKAFFVSMGPVGWATLAISGLVSVITLFSSRTSTAAKFQKLLSGHMRDAATEAATERTELDRLKGKLEGCKVGTKEYNDTKQEIIDKFGKYDSTLKNETLTVQTLRDKYNSLTAAIMQSAKTRQYNKFVEAQQTAFDEQFSEISDKLWEKLNDQYYTEKASKYYSQIMNAFFGGQSLDAWLTTGSAGVQRLVRQLQKLRNAQNAIGETARNRFGITATTPTTTKPNTTDNDPLNPDNPDGASAGGDSRNKWSLDNDAAFLAEKKKLRQKFADGEIATEREYQGELLALEIAALKARLAANKESGADRSKLETQLADKLLELKKNESEIWEADFEAQKQKLRKQFANGEITTEQEYQDKLLALEIASLEARLASNKDAGEARAKLEDQLSDKLIEQKKREQQQADAAEDLRIQNMTNATDRENADYERKKKQHAGNAAALEQLEAQHNRNLVKIELQRAMDALKQEEDEYKQSRRVMQERHKIELQTATLTKTERARLERQQYNELKVLDEEYLRSTLAQLQSLNATGTMSFRDLKGVLQTIDIDSSLLSEEEKNDLIRRIKEVNGAIDAAAEQVDELGYSFTQNQSGGSLFGFSQEDWSLFFENIGNGKFGAEELTVALLAATEAANMAIDLYSGYDKMMTTKENASLKKFKKNQDERKKSMENRLKAGLMTQEQYDAETERMDEEYDKKQKELEIRQAKRQKAQNLAQATIATARAIAEALPNLVLAAIAGAMGAAQIAMIAATPIAGAEEGSFLVERAQDGRKFNARINPDARGYIDRPTVLVGENGMEYVIPNEAMQNPTAAPIINTIEAVRQKGRLRDFDFTQVMPAMVQAPGYAAGGPANGSMPSISLPTAPVTDIPENKAMIQILTRLAGILEKPLKSDVSLMGRGGFLEKMAEYERMKERGKLG